MITDSPPSPAPGRYDFGLSAAQEERAAKLHRESIVFDMLSQQAGGNIFEHYPKPLQEQFRRKLDAVRDPADTYGDALWIESIYWPFEMSRTGQSDLLREWFAIGGLSCGTFSDIRVHDGHDPFICDKEARVLRYAQLPWLRLVTCAEQIREAKRDGILAMYANCQPATPAPRDLKAFDRAYNLGLRSFMLTYNRMDHIGVGCTERVDAGLSQFGVDVVKHCNDIGMIVDVSHCGHLTTLDACRHSKKPVTANHTSARSLYFHARGKSDDALQAIADTGGVIGVLALPSFLTDAAVPTIEHMLNHIDYISERVGWRHVAIGTDWPNQAPDDVLIATVGAELKALGYRQEHNVDVTRRLVGYSDCRDLPNITRGLVRRGYSDEEIRGILGENAIRVFGEVCG
jgi:membrane dipeptidase